MTKLMSYIADHMPLMLMLFAAATATIVGDLFAKYWSLNHRPVLLWLALIGYFFGSVFYIPSLLREGLVVTSTIWSLVSTIGFIALGIFLFNEHLTPWQVVGVMFGAFALVIFAFAEK